jgi:hypothetical protein
MTTVLNFGVTSGKMNVVGICTGGNYAQKWASYFALLDLTILYFQ